MTLPYSGYAHKRSFTIPLLTPHFTLPPPLPLQQKTGTSQNGKYRYFCFAQLFDSCAEVHGSVALLIGAELVVLTGQHGVHEDADQRSHGQAEHLQFRLELLM